VSEFSYVGSELELFARARNWKAYWVEQVRPFISGDVLEVGAGLGANTRLLDSGVPRRWVCLEPDARLADRLLALPGRDAGGRYTVVCGTLRDIGSEQRFDTVIYVDVLEHIEQDREELMGAASHLHPGGRVVVLSPAHQWLFSPFDAAVGHVRRYSGSMLRNASPPALRLERIGYLDSVGLLASAANRLLLRQSMPNRRQVRFWDDWMVPISRRLDRLLGYSLGKSILAVWQKP
jgi:SAM-dependent methyltransferase